MSHYGGTSHHGNHRVSLSLHVRVGMLTKHSWIIKALGLSLVVVFFSLIRFLSWLLW